MAIRYKLLSVHALLLSLFGLIVYTFVTLNTNVLQLTDTDFRSGIGSQIISSIPKSVEQGGQIHIQRKAVGEPQGCHVRIERYLMPLDDPRIQLFVGQFERLSVAKGTILDITIDIPYSIPPGMYMYVSRANYHCSWFNYIFGPYQTQGIPFHINVIPGKL
jgi:hypothetical protein